MIKNYQIFKQTITSVIQESGLDVGIVYFILKDILHEIESIYNTQISRELMEQQATENNDIKDKETISE